MCTFVEGCHFKRATRPGRGLVEYEDNVLALKKVSDLTSLLLGLELSCKVYHVKDLLLGVVLERKKTSSLEINIFEIHIHTSSSGTSV